LRAERGFGSDVLQAGCNMEVPTLATAAKKDHLQLERLETPDDPTSGVPDTTIGGTDIYFAYNAARMYAVNAAYLLAMFHSEDAAKNAAADADRAVAWLTEAVARGFMDTARLKKDTDLDFLRDREDFKRLVAEVESKSKT
jgi:hypothetical protein